MTRIFLIVHPEVDPQAPGSEGMSDAFERNSIGEIIHTSDLSEARAWRDRFNVGVDDMEPTHFILALYEDGTQQRVH